MIVGFDAKRAFFNRSGLGNYSRNLINSVCHYYPENTYQLYSPIFRKETSAFPVIPTNAEIVFPGSLTGKLFSPVWRSLSLTRKVSFNKTNIYHGLSNELPLNIKKFSSKKIVTIHDLIFLRHPELYAFTDRKIYEIKFKKACHNADTIIAVSAQTKNDLKNYFNIRDEKIKIVYQTCDPLYFNFIPDINESRRVREKYGLPENYLLYLGTIEERKNLLTLLKAIKHLPENTALPLVVIGKKKNDYFRKVIDFIASNHLENKVIFPEGVSNEELPWFYNGAEIFIYPSLFEGFGIPVLEALLCRVPVITSNSSSLPEAAGPSSEFINPSNAEELAFKIQAILSSSEKKRAMIYEGNEWAQKFHPAVTSAELMKAYLE